MGRGWANVIENNACVSSHMRPMKTRNVSLHTYLSTGELKTYTRLFLFKRDNHNVQLSAKIASFCKAFENFQFFKMGISFSKASPSTIIPSSKAEILGPYVVTFVQNTKVE